MQGAHATPSDEVKLRQNETAEEAPQPKVHVEDVTIEGAPDLEESIRARIGDRLPEDGFESDSDWTRYIEETAKEVLQDNGYFLAEVSAQARVLSTDSEEERVSVCCQVAEGQQYRLSDIQFTGVRVFPPWELRNGVPLYDGDVFDLGKIREGIDAWTRLYGSLGYINFTATPDVKIDHDRQVISVVFKLDEDKQFRVGSVEVVGLDREISSGALKMKLKPGNIFNYSFVEDFFNDNKSLLPTDVSPRQNADVKQDPKNDTVAIVFDVRPCPQPPSE